MIDDVVASSTRVRAAVKRGDFVEVSRLLGRPFPLCSIVATESNILWAKEIQDLDCRIKDETDFSEIVFSPSGLRRGSTSAFLAKDHRSRITTHRHPQRHCEAKMFFYE